MFNKDFLDFYVNIFSIFQYLDGLHWSQVSPDLGPGWHETWDDIKLFLTSQFSVSQLQLRFQWNGTHLHRTQTRYHTTMKTTKRNRNDYYNKRMITFIWTTDSAILGIISYFIPKRRAQTFLAPSNGKWLKMSKNSGHLSAITLKFQIYSKVWLLHLILSDKIFLKFD